MYKSILTNKEILMEVQNKSLANFGVRVEHFKSFDGWFGKLYWYEYFKFTRQEFNQFKKWFYQRFKDEKNVEDLFYEYYLTYGLKIKK